MVGQRAEERARECAYTCSLSTLGERSGRGHQATSVSDAGEATLQRTPRDTNRALLPELRVMINQDNERRERLLDQDQIDDVRKREVVPGRNATRSELRELAQLASSSFGHPTGTCRIGTDNMSVVDPELRMHSIQNLRVADSSVMPSVPAAAISAAAHLIGGKAATLLQA